MGLQQGIRDLLQNATGDEFLKRLFWEILGYDRLNAVLPQGLLRAELAGHFWDIRLFAECQGLKVVYARMTTAGEGAVAIRELADCIRDRLSYALLVVSSSDFARWHFAFHRVGKNGDDLRHFSLGVEADSPDVVASRLARLRTTTPEGDDRPLAALLNTYDSVFGMGRSAWRRLEEVDLWHPPARHREPIGLCLRCRTWIGGTGSYCDRCLRLVQKRHEIWQNLRPGLPQAKGRKRLPSEPRLICLDLDRPHSTSLFMSPSAKLSLGFWLWKQSER